MMNGRGKPLSAVLEIYLIYCTFRAIECFILQTDQTIFDETFVHELTGTFTLFAGVKLFEFKAKETDLDKNKTVQYIAKRLAPGVITLMLAYLAEVLMLALQGKLTGLALYVGTYVVDGNTGHRMVPVFLAFCMIGNIIDVAVEEGISRGLFPKLLEQRYTYTISAVIALGLLGLWHIIAPTRNYCDDIMSLEGLIANSVMLVVTTCLVSFKFAMITKLTGDLYMAMGDHFFSNIIVNIFHVISITDADEFAVLRISVVQSISSITVLLWCLATQRERCLGL